MITASVGMLLHLGFMFLYDDEPKEEDKGPKQEDEQQDKYHKVIINLCK